MKIIVERNDTRWTVTDDVTGVVGKGRTRDAAIACYNRGVELWKAKQAGYDSIDYLKFKEDRYEKRN